MLELVVKATAALSGEATVHLWLVDDERRELRLVAESGARPGKRGSGSRRGSRSARDWPAGWPGPGARS